MYKIKCEDCNSVFDHEDVKIRKENMGEHFGSPAYEEIACCPNCGADGLVEVQQCEKCGEYFESYELDDGFCEQCQAETSLRLRQMIEANFSGVDLRIIRNLQGVV